jgi:hypothetical protein
MKTRIINTLLLLVFCLRFTPAYGAAPREIVVAPSGSDTAGNGSLRSPYATIDRALAAAGEGNAAIVLRGGTYRLRSAIRISIPNITIRSYTGEWAHLAVSSNDSAIAQVIEFYLGSEGGRIQRLEISGGSFHAVKMESGWGWASNPARNITVEDSVLHDTGRDIIKITPGTSNITIRRCHLYNSGRRDNSNAEGIDNVNSHNMVVQDNYIHDIATSGLYAKGGAKNALIERNLIVNAGGNGIALGFTTDPEWFDPDNSMMYEAIDGVVRNNIVINSGMSGVGLFAALRPQVYNNTLINTGRVYHASISVQPNANPYHKHPSASENVVIRNNIVVQPADASTPAFLIRCHSGVNPCISGLSGTLAVSNNLYYKPGGANFLDERPGRRYSGGFSGWKNHVSEAGSLEGNPNLDAGYHLTSSSPALNAGIAVPGLSHDYDGEPRSGAFDIGADEFGGSALPVPPPSGTTGTGRANQRLSSASPADRR